MRASGESLPVLAVCPGSRRCGVRGGRVVSLLSVLTCGKLMGRDEVKCEVRSRWERKARLVCRYILTVRQVHPAGKATQYEW